MHFMEAKSVLSVSAQLVQNTISDFTREPPSLPIFIFLVIGSSINLKCFLLKTVLDKIFNFKT